MRSRPWVNLVGPFVSALLLAGQAFAQLPGVPAVQAGMRVTYYSSSASVRGTSRQAVIKPGCDPSKEDCWIDPTTGRQIGLDDVPTASGQGFTVLDILYLDAQACVMRITSYLLEPSTQKVTTAAMGGEVSTTGGTCFDFWTDPARLRQMQPQATDTYRVFRGPYTVGSVTFEAVAVASSGAGGTSNTAYDSVSGLLVVASSRAQGASVPTITSNALVAGAGNTQLTYTQLLAARVVPGMGAVENLPATVLNANLLTYDCSYVTQVAGVGGMETPCSVEVRLGQRTNAWATVHSRQSAPDPVTGANSTVEANNVIVAGGHGGYFAAPSLLAGLRVGSTIDVDPVTGIRTTVAYVDDSVVSILEESNAERKTFVYDRGTGWLTQLVTEQYFPTGSYATKYRLTGVR